MNVIKKIVDLCLNIEAKYVGRRTVTQQGAKRAATPAKNEAINDALIKSSIFSNLTNYLWCLSSCPLIKKIWLNGQASTNKTSRLFWLIPKSAKKPMATIGSTQPKIIKSPCFLNDLFIIDIPQVFVWTVLCNFRSKNNTFCSCIHNLEHFCLFRLS